MFSSDQYQLVKQDFVYLTLYNGVQIPSEGPLYVFHSFLPSWRNPTSIYHGLLPYCPPRWFGATLVIIRHIFAAKNIAIQDLRNTLHSIQSELKLSVHKIRKTYIKKKRQPKGCLFYSNNITLLIHHHNFLCDRTPPIRHLKMVGSRHECFCTYGNCMFTLTL